MRVPSIAILLSKTLTSNAANICSTTAMFLNKKNSSWKMKRPRKAQAARLKQTMPGRRKAPIAPV